MWKLGVLPAACAALVAVLAAACGDDTGAAGPDEYTEERSEEIARTFVVEDETYAFDGMEGTLELVKTEDLEGEGAWAFVYTFESAHAGYGDRTDQVVAEVITPHEARVVVEKYRVTSAVLDGTWDMLNEEMVQ